MLAAGSLNVGNAALAAVATLLAAAFTLATWDRWLRRRKPHELAWTVSLALFTLGAAALWWAETSGWSLANFRLFFLAGAVLNVPWLALGTVYLLAGERAGRITQHVLVGLSGLATGVMLTAPTKAAIEPGTMPTGKEVFGVFPRVLAALGSGVAALVVIGGVVWTLLTRRRGHPPALIAGNVLIAAGTLILSASGTLAGRLGKDRSFAVTLAAGIAVLFAGFLVTTAAPRRAQSPVAPSIA